MKDLKTFRISRCVSTGRNVRRVGVRGLRAQRQTGAEERVKSLNVETRPAVREHRN